MERSPAEMLVRRNAPLPPVQRVEQEETHTAAPSPARLAVSAGRGAAWRSGDVLALQSAVGNRAVRGTIQAERTGSSPEHQDQLDAVHQHAQAGMSGAGEKLPFFEQIQKSFGHHDISDIQAHTGNQATESAHAIGARAYMTSGHVVFANAPTLRTAAHEAAHGVQQRSGLQLEGGVGKAGDQHENHADAVADLVVQGKSSEALLDQYGAPTNSHSPAGNTDTRQHINANESAAAVIQRDQIPNSDKTEMAQTATNALPMSDKVFKIKDLATKIASTAQKYKEKGGIGPFFKGKETLSTAALLADLATKTTSLASAFGNFPKTEAVAGKAEVATYILKAADLIANLADDSELKEMQANPGNYEAAKKWALKTADIFKKAGDIIPDKMDGIAPGWLSYFKLLFAAPFVIINAFCNILEKRYETIDKETGVTGTKYKEVAKRGDKDVWKGELTPVFIGAQHIDADQPKKLQEFMDKHQTINGMDLYDVTAAVGKGLLISEISAQEPDLAARERWIKYLSK